MILRQKKISNAGRNVLVMNYSSFEKKGMNFIS